MEMTFTCYQYVILIGHQLYDILRLDNPKQPLAGQQVKVHWIHLHKTSLLGLD